MLGDCKRRVELPEALAEGMSALVASEEMPPAVARDSRHPKRIVEMWTKAIINEFVGKPAVASGGCIGMFRGNQAMSCHIRNLLNDMAVMAALAIKFRPFTAAMSATGTSLPDAGGKGSSPTSVGDIVARARAGDKEAGAKVVSRIVVIAARNRLGHVALRMLTPLMGLDGNIAKFSIDDMSPKEIRAEKTPCGALEAMFLWDKPEAKHGAE